MCVSIDLLSKEFIRVIAWMIIPICAIDATECLIVFVL